MTSPVANVCVDANLIVGDDGLLRFAKWAFPRLVLDERANSGQDGPMGAETSAPGKLLIDWQGGWLNESPVEHMVRIVVTRRYKTWITSNPNAIQFRDRWSWAIDADAAEPVTSGIFNGQVGSAGDIGTNTVAEPEPGKLWTMWGTTSADEWVGPLEPDQHLDVKFRCYVWTPPPWSGNANKNSPEHRANAGWARIQLIAYPLPNPDRELVT